MVQGWNDGSEDYNVIHKLKKLVAELEAQNKELRKHITDEEKFLEMLNNNSVYFTLEVTKDTGYKTVILEPDDELPANKRKVDGYTGFRTEFTFDEKGKLYQIGIWE